MSDRSPASRFPRTGMDPIRDRRSGANFLDARVAGDGLEWRDGKLHVRIGRKEPIRTDRGGSLVFEFDPETMEVSPGSPYRVRAKVAPAQVASVKAENTRLAAENASLLAANAALVLRVEALEAAVVTNADAVSGLDDRVQVLEAVIP